MIDKTSKHPITGYMNNVSASKKHKFSNVSRAADLRLLGGARCLDFANTASGRDGEHYLEHFQQPQHVVAWACHAGVIGKQDAKWLEQQLMGQPAAAQALLSRAVGLRDAIYALGETKARGKPTPPRSLKTISATYAHSLKSAELRQDEGQLHWRWAAVDKDGSGILGPLALSAIVLFGSDSAARVKRCAGEDCGWLFLDISKNGNRRWCDMQVCGNRAKLRAFRQRKSGSRSP